MRAKVKAIYMKSIHSRKMRRYGRELLRTKKKTTQLPSMARFQDGESIRSRRMPKHK